MVKLALSRKSFLFIILILFSQYSLRAQQKKAIKITIDRYLHLTYDAFFKKLSMSSSVGEIGNIEGFNFEWGNRYNLVVEKAILKNPPEDGSSVEFRLIRLISKTKADSSFSFY